MSVVVALGARAPRQVQALHGAIADVPPRGLGPPLTGPLTVVGRPSDITPVHGLNAPTAASAPGHAIDAIGRARRSGVTRREVPKAVLGLKVPLARNEESRRAGAAQRP